MENSYRSKPPHNIVAVETGVMRMMMLYLFNLTYSSHQSCIMSPIIIPIILEMKEVRLGEIKTVTYSGS